MIDSIKIQPMKLEDIESVLIVERQSFITPWSYYSFLSELRDNDLSSYLVLKVNDYIVGYGGMWIVFDEAHITNIAIKPEYRGKKLGKVLLNKMIKIAKLKGGERMTLEVRKSNINAIKMYKKAGFEAIGVRKEYYSDTKEDALIMWKEVLD